MLKKYEVENIIKDALMDLGEECKESESGISTDMNNGDIIFYFKENIMSKSKPDKYRIKVIIEE